RHQILRRDLEHGVECAANIQKALGQSRAQVLPQEIGSVLLPCGTRQMRAHRLVVEQCGHFTPGTKDDFFVVKTGVAGLCCAFARCCRDSSWTMEGENPAYHSPKARAAANST